MIRQTGRIPAMGIGAVVFGLVGTTAFAGSQAQRETTAVALTPQGPQVVRTTGTAAATPSSPTANGGTTVLPIVASGAVWSHESGLEGWVPRTVSTGSAGTQVFTSVGPLTDYTRTFSSFDQNPPLPILQYVSPTPTLHHQVASADTMDVHAEVFDVDSGQPGLRRVVVKVFSPTVAGANWSYNWPTLTNGHDKIAVRISRDGTKVVAFVYNIYTNRVDVASFGPTSAAPVSTFAADIGNTFNAIDLSADGTKVVLTSSLRVQVHDVANGSVLYTSIPFVTLYSSLGISGDGSCFAFGTNGQVRVFRRNASTGQYSAAYTLSVAGQNYCDRLDVSDDGSTLVAGFNYMDTFRRVDVVALDLTNYTTLWTDTIVGQGAWQNVVSDVAVSANGSRIAGGLWGDELGAAPEIRTYRRTSATPLRSIDLPGSVYDLDLSADGRRLAVASKATHANVAAGGGRVQLYEVENLDVGVAGIPHVGGTVQVHLRGTPGHPAVLFTSPTLMGTPQTFPNIGTLFLSRTGLGVLPVGTFDASGDAFVNLNTGSTVGATLYLQGYSSSPRRLGHDWVRLTVVP